MTLSTREDGGIDWEKINLGRTNSHPYVSGDKSWGIVEFAREAAAHTRERCAKWHDEQANDCAMSIDAEMLHRESAAAIRKMED